MELDKTITNFELLDSNLLQILQQAALSQPLCQYLQYDVVSPTLQTPVADPSTLLMSKLYPTPFDETVITTDCSNLRVYYLIGDLENNMVVSESTIAFDIVVAKSLWLMQNADGSSAIRPYRIMNEIVKQFRDKSVGTVGRLLFKNFRQIAVNHQFDAVRLTARMTGFSGN